MSYIDQMRRSGNWLFRWRGYLPVVFIAIVLASLTRFRFLGGSEIDDELWEGLCLAVSACGLLIRALTVGYAAAETSGRNARAQRAASLNTRGAYSMVRHPLYVGNFLIWMGIALYPHQWLVVLVCVTLYWLYYERIIVAEEAFLAEKFGESFLEWALRTPAFLPDFRAFRAPDCGFSLRTVLKREYPAFSGTIFTMFILEVAGDYEVLGRFDLDTLWVTLLALAIATHLILRTLKKHTHLLHEPGR